MLETSGGTMTAAIVPLVTGGDTNGALFSQTVVPLPVEPKFELRSCRNCGALYFTTEFPNGHTCTAFEVKLTKAQDDEDGEPNHFAKTVYEMQAVKAAERFVADFDDDAPGIDSRQLSIAHEEGTIAVIVTAPGEEPVEYSVSGEYVPVYSAREAPKPNRK